MIYVAFIAYNSVFTCIFPKVRTIGGNFIKSAGKKKIIHPIHGL